MVLFGIYPLPSLSWEDCHVDGVVKTYRKQKEECVKTGGETGDSLKMSVWSNDVSIVCRAKTIVVVRSNEWLWSVCV